MGQDRTRSEWAGCSNFKERREELRKAHEEFQRLLDNGFKIKEVRVKRPRIQKEKTPHKVEVSVMNGLVKVIVDFTEWQEHGSVGTIVKKIY